MDLGGLATATDICDPSPTITNDAPALFTLGTTVVTWTATDSSGNSSSATQNVEVEDTTSPVVVAPADVTVECSTQGGQAVNIGTATATDICDPSPTITNDAPGLFTLGITVVTWTATDVSGNSATATQNVEVEDTTSPDLTVPADVIATCGEPVNIGTATATDICDPNPTVTNDAPPSFPFGTTIVTWTAADVSGNSATATQNVTVEDDITPPVFTFVPVDVTVECSVQGGQSVNIGGPATATDACDPSPTITNDAPALFQLGTTVVTWTAADAAGNSATATQNVEVEDTTSPDLTPPADVIASCGDPVDIGTATATDICDPNPSVTNDAPPSFPFGTTIVTWTATDATGNSVTATQNVMVEDDITPPVFTFIPADVTVECSAQGGQSVNIGGPATATDACDPSPTIINDAPALFLLGTTVVTWTATDSGGNSSTATQNVTVEDTTPPVLVPPPDVAVECVAQGGQPVDIGTATATDICDPAPTITNDAPAQFPLGTTIVTWTATDASGNTAFATQNVTVEDDATPPVLTIPSDITVECSSQEGQAVEIGTATATDICDPSPTITNDAPELFFLGTTIVTWTATDASGNAASAEQLVTVVDTIPPKIRAALVRANHAHHHGMDDLYHDDDDDDGGDKHAGKNVFCVLMEGADLCDPDPEETGVIRQPLTPTDLFEVSYKHKKKNRIKIKIKKNKIVVKLKGPDGHALENLLNEAILAGGFPVMNEQKVKLVVKHKKKDDEDDDDDGHQKAVWKYAFDEDLKLIGVSGPAPNLLAYSTDSSGNVSDLVEVPVPKGKGKGNDHAKVAKIGSGERDLLGEGGSVLGGSPGVRLAMDPGRHLSFRLDQNYPNPFNPETTIRYSVPEASDVRLTIYNIQGQQIRMLVNGPHSPGDYRVRWDGRDASGRGVSTGIYLYRLEAATNTALRKMLFAK